MTFSRTHPRRARCGHGPRPVPRRARRAARRRGRRLRQAAADDGAAVRHHLHRRRAWAACHAAEARRLGVRAGAVLVGLWVVASRLRAAVPAGVPDAARARRSSARRWSSSRPPFDFVDLYIPSNPFHSLANNVVPAVVLFAVVLGVALIGLERKQVLLDVLARGQRRGVAGRRSFVVRLTPYGMFAIAATPPARCEVEQTRAHPGLPGDLRRHRAARRAVGAAGAGGRADADPVPARCSAPTRDALHHGVHGGRPLHRAAER